jgi:hypothetical protein
MESVLEHALAYVHSPVRGWRHYLDGETTLSGLGFGVVRLPHRMWRVGDHVLCYYSNGGGERWPTYGCSSRFGRFVGGAYAQWFRYPGTPPNVWGLELPRAVRQKQQDSIDRRFYAKQARRGRVRFGADPEKRYPAIIEDVGFQPPSELADVQLKRLADSDVRRLVEALRGAYSASR